MANDETPRFRWPFPAWDADWQKWQDVFGDLVNNIDATVFSSVDGSRLIFKSIPSAEIVSNGPGYDLVMSGNLVMQSRAHGVEITIPAGTYSLTALAVAAMTSTPGAVGSKLISWEMIEGGVSASPDVVPMGYVDASYNITWWNGVRLVAGAGSSPLFGTTGGSGGTPGGSDGQIQYNNGGSFGGAAQFIYADGTDKVGLRNAVPFFDLDIVNAAGANASIAVRTYDDVFSPSFVCAKSRGAAGARTAVEALDSLGSISFMGFYGSGDFNVHNTANIVAEAIENFTASDGGTDLAIYTCKPGETVAGKTATFTSEGNLEMWNGGVKLNSYNSTAVAGAIEWDGTNFRGHDGTSWIDLDGGGGGGTLDASYDFGGAGLGRSITADAGAVTITNAVADATNALELTRSTAGSGSALSITQQVSTGSALKIVNDLDAFQAEAGSSIFLTSSGTGRQNIWSDQELYIGSSVPALGVYLKNVAAGTSLLRVQSEATGATGDGTTWVTASGAGDGTGYLLLQASGAGTGAETSIDIKAQAGSTGPGHVDITASGGSAYVLAGAGTCAVRLNDENRAASTWGQAYIPLSDVSTEWDALEANCSGEVSLIQAINLAFDGAGGTPVTLAASATTGGLDLTVQEIGFQAAGAGTPVAASTASLGDPTVTSQTHESVIDVDGVWYAGGVLSPGDAGTIFRHDGGTSWTSLLNPLNTSNYGYSWLVYFGGEIWCGGFDFPSDLVHSYNPTNDTWTGRGSNASMRPLMSGCVFDGDMVVGDNDGYVFRNTTGTTWDSLGQPGGTTLDAKSLISDGTDLYVTQGTKVYKYVTGTTWTDLSCPITTIGALKNWNGTLILSGEDGSGWPVVYKYDGASWTQLGGPLVAGTASAKCLAVNSANKIYAVYLTTGTQHVMGYDEIGDSWSEAISTGSGADAKDGSFNSNNELAMPGDNNVQQFKDAYTEPVNGYITSEDWRTFNDKVAAAAVIADHSVVRGDGGAKGVQGSTLLISDTGQLSTGSEAAPDVDPGGICLNHGAGTDSVLTTKSSDIAHPFTSLAQADTYMEVRKHVQDSGGALIRGFTETTTAFEYRGYAVTASTGTYAAIQLTAYLSDGGTGVTDFSNNSNIVGFRNNGTMKHQFRGGGDAAFAGALTVGSRVGTSQPAGTMEWDGTNFRGYDGSSWLNLDGTGGGTLDAAYDYGGAGLGRSITADSGAVAITNAANDATNTMELTRSDGGVSATGSPLRIVNDLDTFQTEAGSSIFLTSTGSGRQSIWSDKELYIGSSVNSLGVYLKNVTTTSSILRVQSEATGTAGDGQLWLTASGASNGTANVLVQASGSGTGGSSNIVINAAAGSTGPGYVEVKASGGAAYVALGSGNCDIRLHDDNQAGSSWGTAYIGLSSASADWTDLSANCGGVVTLFEALNLAFDRARLIQVTERTTAISLTTIHSGELYTNTSATGEVIFTLPTASAGLKFEFYVDAAQWLQVKPNTSDSIIIDGISSSLYYRNNVVGSFLRVVALDSSRWVATDVRGTWEIGS